jgi:hypothetical protein
MTLLREIVTPIDISESETYLYMHVFTYLQAVSCDRWRGGYALSTARRTINWHCGSNFMKLRKMLQANSTRQHTACAGARDSACSSERTGASTVDSSRL